MPIENGEEVELEYELRDSEGELIESSTEEGGAPMRYVHGDGQLPAKVEQALTGKQEGDQVAIDLEPGEAFGPYDPEGLVTVPRSDLPADAEIVPGDWITVGVDDDDEDDGEEELEARVVEVSPEGIVLDLNHPLAQEPVHFWVKVRRIGATG